MKKVIIAIFLISASLARAQTAQRTFVSAASGNDANACSRVAPCRQFAAAIAKTSAGGEVIVLDSGGYGTVSISQAVSLISPAGVYAGVTAFSGNAVTINAGASDVVVLRGLTLNALGGANGIQYNSGGVQHLENLVISGFSESGVNFAGAGELFVKDSTVRNCGLEGIEIAPFPGLARVIIDRSHLNSNANRGLWVGDNGRVVIRDSVTAHNTTGIRTLPTLAAVDLSIENCVVAHNQSGGILAAGGATALVNVSVSNSMIASNTSSGIGAGSFATVRISSNTITRNDTGVVQGLGSTVESVGNNIIRGNATEVTGTITLFAPM